MRIWFYFMVLTGTTLLFLWMLQISFIRPYYERSRQQVIMQKAHETERLFIQGMKEEEFDHERFSKILAKENMCGSIYDEEGKLIETSKSNMVCILNALPKNTILEYIDMTKEASNDSFSIRFSADIFDQGMFFYGKTMQGVGEDYYLFLNAPMELLDSTVYVLRRQFALLAVIVFSTATLVSFLLSRHLSQPIENLTDSAKRLGGGDFEVSFSGEGYREVETLAQTLNYATEEFRKTDDLRRDLIANVSHDYKTPLTMIRAYAEMIRDLSGNNPQKREAHLQIILDEVDHLERLVNDMLTLSKYESEMYDVNENVFNLKEHIEKTLQLFPWTDWHVELDCPSNLEVLADEVKMGQVLYNYMSNVLKYAERGQYLSIRVEEKKEDCYVYLCDRGPGLTAEEQEGIWDRYYKIDKNHYRDVNQSGLGLSIVKAICDATGSDYGVLSEVDKGSCFYYSLKKHRKKT